MKNINNTFIIFATLDFLDCYVYSIMRRKTEHSTTMEYIEHLKINNPQLIVDIKYNETELSTKFTIICDERELMRHKLLYSEPKFKVGHGYLRLVRDNNLLHVVNH